MMRKRIYIVLSLALCLAAHTLTGQVRPRVAGLETDSTYMSLLGEETRLRSSEDSLVGAVGALREKLRTDRDNIQLYSQNIIALEGWIFDIRNNIGRIASRTSAIEQEFILNNLGAGPAADQAGQTTGGAQSPGDLSRNLIENPYFKENMSPEDYAALSLAQKKEGTLASYVRVFGTNYSQLSKIADEYAKAEEAPIADSLWAHYVDQKRILAAISDSVATFGDYIWDTKSYSYTLLLDLMNKTQAIEEFSGKGAQARSAEAQLGGNAESVPVAAYPLRKRLTLDYETTLARTLGLDKALDSLSRALADVDAMKFDYPPIVLDEKLFLEYAPITIHSPATYNAANPIPPLTIYEKGTIYRILLGSFLKAQPVSIFRGAAPIGLWRTGDGKYNYYAGGFATRDEALAALEQMKKAGFRSPQIALWDYGDYSLPDETRPAASGELFRVYISGVKGDLSSAVKEAIREAAPGKDIIRIGERFTVGTFTSEGEAKKTAAAIKAADPVLEATVSDQSE